MLINPNSSQIVHHTSDELVDAIFMDDRVVVVGLNKTTGDYYILNYQGAQPNPVSLTTRMRHDMFFSAPGEKVAFVIGANSAKSRIEHFTEELAGRRVNVLTLEPEAVPIKSGPQVYHDLQLNPQNGEFTLTRKGEKPITFSPFSGPLVSQSPSMADKIDTMCDFAATINNESEPLSGGSVSPERIANHVGDIVGRANSLHRIAVKPELYDALKSFFNDYAPSSSGKSDIVLQDAFLSGGLPGAMSAFVAKIDLVYEGWKEMMERDSLPPKVSETMRSIKAKLTECYQSLKTIADNEHLTDLSEAISQKLAGLRSKSKGELRIT